MELKSDQLIENDKGKKAVLISLEKVLQGLREKDKILIALLYGSYANGLPHNRSDIDIAIYVNTGNEKDIEIIDEILMSVEKNISILRLDDEDESQFVVQEALKGKHMVKPDEDTLYDVALRALHDTEDIRFRRMLNV